MKVRKFFDVLNIISSLYFLILSIAIFFGFVFISEMTFMLMSGVLICLIVTIIWFGKAIQTWNKRKEEEAQN